MNLPSVSIVIPSYKPAHFEQALRSAIGQTYSNIEIIVSDNCPTEEIKKICFKFPEVIYQRCSVLGGSNVLAALFSAKGVYIKPLFDDDILHPFCVERMVSAISIREDVEMVFSQTSTINYVNEKTQLRKPYASSGLLLDVDLKRSMIMSFTNVVGEFSSILFKREKIWKIGPKDLFFYEGVDFTKGLADVVFYLNLTRDSYSYYIDEELSYFRCDSSIASNSNPTSNGDFGYCISDWIDLLILTHSAGAITTKELFDARNKVDYWVRVYGEIYEQVRASGNRYAVYISDMFM